ncbi:MAG: hypothetical protein GXX96_39270 [Planctomycetaceae bacterium]|nr:hypothetical protein [Planctomycetaceae bacterium]
MVLVAEREYCDGAAGCSCGGGGAGQLVSQTRHVDAATWHTTDYEYDWRGRQLKVFPPADIHTSTSGRSAACTTEASSISSVNKPEDQRIHNRRRAGL